MMDWRSRRILLLLVLLLYYYYYLLGCVVSVPTEGHVAVQKNAQVHDHSFQLQNLTTGIHQWQVWHSGQTEVSFIESLLRSLLASVLQSRESSRLCPSCWSMSLRSSGRHSRLCMGVIGVGCSNCVCSGLWHFLTDTAPVYCCI